MSVAANSALTSTNSNNAFVSRTVNTSMTGTLDNQNTTDASSSTTGAVKTAGGLGVAKKLYVGTDANVSGTLSTSGFVQTGNTATPYFRKYTKTYSDLSFAGLTNDIELFSLPANGYIDDVVISHSASFTGGSISAYALSVGISGNLDDLKSAFDVFQSTGPIDSAKLGKVYSKSSATSIRLAATSVGANLSAATAGSVDVWVKYSVLP
jgi:hypothetical protein